MVIHVKRERTKILRKRVRGRQTSAVKIQALWKGACVRVCYNDDMRAYWVKCFDLDQSDKPYVIMIMEMCRGYVVLCQSYGWLYLCISVATIVVIFPIDCGSQSLDLLISYLTTTLASHVSIILIITLTIFHLFSTDPNPKPTDQLIQVLLQYVDTGDGVEDATGVQVLRGGK